MLAFLRLHDLQILTFSKHVKPISLEHVILKSCQDLVKQLLNVKRLPCRGVQVINHGSSRSSRIARQNLLSIVTFCTFQRLWRRSDGKERNYNAETGKLRHYFEVSRWNVALLDGGPQMSRQKQNTSRQNRKPHGKTKNLTAKTKYLTTKPKPSLQNQRPHGKTKYFTAKFLVSKKFLPWGFWFCCDSCGQPYCFAPTAEL